MVTTNADATVTATFGSAKRSITTYRDGAGEGTITSQPTGIQCGLTCSATYNLGSHVMLHAAPSPGSRFVGWNGGGCSGTADCDVAVNGNKAITGTFETDVRWELSVAEDGAGTGSVTSDPAGIACGATCSSTFDDQTIVTLHAAPASNSTFAGWGGACSGASDCTLTLNGPKAVTATFGKSSDGTAPSPPPPLTGTGSNQLIVDRLAPTTSIQLPRRARIGKAFIVIRTNEASSIAVRGTLNVPGASTVFRLKSLTRVVRANSPVRLADAPQGRRQGRQESAQAQKEAEVERDHHCHGQRGQELIPEALVAFETLRTQANHQPSMPARAAQSSADYSSA
jgi:hypothetical protein